MTIFLTSQDVASLFSIDDYIAAVENAYRQAGEGNTMMISRTKVDSRERRGFLKILPAALWADGVAGIHAYTGGGGYGFLKVILLFDAESGNLQAILESDRIGWLVPGAASAVATKYLARKDARVLGIFGSGRQARSQLLAVSRIRDLSVVKVFSPHKSHRETYCEDMKKALGLNVVAVGSPAEAIRGSHIISVATNANNPVIDGNAIEPGTHINAIGAHDPARRELDGICIKRGRLFVDSRDRALQEEGALLIPIAEGLIGPDSIRDELGEVVAGAKEGRTGREDITVFFSGAIATEYVAVAAAVYQKARERGIGMELPLEKDKEIPSSLYVKQRK
jgi:alanine dehydrogenase